MFAGPAGKTSGMGQQRRFRSTSDMSGLPLTPDPSLHCREPTLRADFVAEVRFEGRICRPWIFEADARPLLSDSPRERLF